MHFAYSEGTHMIRACRKSSARSVRRSRHTKQGNVRIVDGSL